MKMEAVVADHKRNGRMETKPEKEKPVKPTSLSSSSDVEEEEERSVGSLKRVSNKKRKRSIADEGRVAKTKSSREKRAARKRKEKGNGDDEEKKPKQRSSVKRRAKTKKEDKEREQELKLVPFIEPTGSCSHSESDSHVKNDNFNDCRSMTRSLRVITTLFLHHVILV